MTNPLRNVKIFVCMYIPYTVNICLTVLSSVYQGLLVVLVAVRNNQLQGFFIAQGCLLQAFSSNYQDFGLCLQVLGSDCKKVQKDIFNRQTVVTIGLQRYLQPLTSKSKRYYCSCRSFLAPSELFFVLVLAVSLLFLIAQTAVYKHEPEVTIQIMLRNALAHS